jgi:putative ATP-binding cassette transporter
MATPADPASAATAAPPGFGTQLATLLRAALRSHAGKAITMLASGILVMLLLTAYGQIQLNQWNKPFYDALSRRDLGDFLYQLGVFFIIAVILLFLNLGQRWMVEMLKLRLRDGLVRDMLHLWMLPGRALQLANSGPMGVNPDQRMHDDAEKLCTLTADLGTGLLQATILFASFAGVLWSMSGDFSVRVGGIEYAVPGYMLWAALIYAVLGSLMSYWVGRSLVERNAERYAREGDLRASLVRASDHLDGIALAGGEAEETRRVEVHFDAVLAATVRLIAGLVNLTWVTAGFGWITVVAPILIAAPLYFTGKISFGGLMMAAAAFQQAQGSLRWFVDNFGALADWRATLLRVASFRIALTAPAVQQRFASRIDYVEGAAGELAIEGLEITSVGSRDAFVEPLVRIGRGERVLVQGHPGADKALLFRALSGLWPWGSGRIVRPAGESVFYLPRGTPYLPRGSLRDVLAYPHDAARFEPAAYLLALGRLQLASLAPALDETRRWDRDLGHDELFRLAVARIVLQRPRWIVVDGTLGVLEDEMLETVLDVIADELRDATILHIGHATLTRDASATRVLHLVKLSEAPSP